MSGLFRYNSNASSPQRRTPMRSFRTTPVLLQDVTADNTYNYGFLSPAYGQGSPSQAKSVRDYEEQITSLQRECFNLKLKIYFLEEKLNESSAMGQGTESLFKQNVDLKVEVEVQKKEKQEKHDLLIQASNAMKYMEDNQKMKEQQFKVTEKELRSRIDLLELEISEMQKIYGPTAPKTNLISLVEGDSAQRQGGDVADGRVKELQEALDRLAATNKETLEAMGHLETMHQEKALKLREFESQNEQLATDNAQLKNKIETLEKSMKVMEELKVQLLDVRKELAEKMCDHHDLRTNLQEKTLAYEQARSAIKILVNDVKILRENGGTNNISCNCDEDLQLMRTQLSNKDVEITNLRAEIQRTMEQKNAEIYELKTDVKRKTANLQSLINKELWDKNREIERLMRQLHGEMESSMSEVNQLHSQYTEAQYNEAVEMNMSLQKKLDELRLKICHSPNGNERIIAKLKQELHLAKTEIETERRNRKECADVCAILTLRLEELAGFLDSLLKHKDVLGALCADRQHAMRKAIDRSLDLSRSINNSTLGITLSEQSLMIGDESFPESLHRENAADNVIEALRAEVKTLRTELEATYKNKEEEHPKKRLHRIDGHSESESWSEPDRNVSAARIGLEERSKKTLYNSSTDEEAEAVTPMKKTLMAEKVAHLEILVTEKENKLLEMEMSHIERENASKEEQLHMNEQLRELQDELNVQRAVNEGLEKTCIDARGTIAEHEGILRELHDQLDAKVQQLDALMKEKDRLAVDLRVLELEMETMRKDAEYVKEKYGKEMSFHLEKARKEYEGDLVAQIQRLDLEHQETVNRDYVTRTAFQQRCDEVDVLRRRLDDTQSTIDAMTETEIELRALCADYERRVRDTQKALDDATMQASQAVLERSRATNDKGQLEAALKDLQMRHAKIQGEKVDLNSRIGYLEHLAATLQNQLVKVNVKSGSSSPDLGIDSDVARVSSSDAGKDNKVSPRISNASTMKLAEDASPSLLEENAELKRRVVRMKRQLEDTVQRLKKSNKQKEQVERDIQTQILKTHSVLKQVRTNMETQAVQRDVPLPPRPSE